MAFPPGCLTAALGATPSRPPPWRERGMACASYFSGLDNSAPAGPARHRAGRSGARSRGLRAPRRRSPSREHRAHRRPLRVPGRAQYQGRRSRETTGVPLNRRSVPASLTPGLGGRGAAAGPGRQEREASLSSSSFSFATGKVTF